MIKSTRKHDKILGIRINSTSSKLVLKNLSASLENFDKNPPQKPILITTPNPEQIVIAQKDLVFANILNSSDISVPDGIGLFAALKFQSLPRAKNVFTRFFALIAQGMGIGFSVLLDKKWLLEGAELIRGREFFSKLVSLANKDGWRVFLVGDKARSAQRAANMLKAKTPKLNVFAETGPELDVDAVPKSIRDKKVEEKVIQKINKVKPHLLFVGFGAPKQEKWVYRNLSNISVCAIMVVGGTFDYVSGKKKLPPKFVEDLGLEWLWRLSTGDQKWPRIKSAILEFPLKVFWLKLTK